MTIDTITVNALLGSGATHSIIGPTLLHKIPQLKDKLLDVKPSIKARAVNGSVISYKQEINFRIVINKELGIHAYYSPILSYDLIIGYEFLRNARLTIDFGTLELIPPREYVIKAYSDISLEPSSETLVWGQLKGKLNASEGILLTHKTLHQMGYRITRGLVTIEESKPWVPVRILNPFPQKLTIRKGTKLATVEVLNKAYQICKVENNKEIANIAKSASQVRFSPPAEFRDLFDLSKSTFNKTQKEELLCLLWEFSDIFLKKGDKLKCADMLEFSIAPKEDAKPFKARPYRSNPKLRKEISKQVHQLLEDGIIRPSRSPYGSPMLLVNKPDGSFRAVVDYRNLNQKCHLDNFPKISCQDSLESLGSANAKYFSTIDLQSGYYQVPIEESSKQYTVFVTHDGLYEFNRMSFGLANAPSMFYKVDDPSTPGTKLGNCIAVLG